LCSSRCDEILLAIIPVRQESSHEQTTKNGNRTEETQHGPSPAPPNIGATAKQGSTCNKRIRWSREKMKEVVWCFLYVKETTSTENYYYYYYYLLLLLLH
jgi:hypothetical protein